MERVAPHNIDAEQGLLASCIHDGGHDIIPLCLSVKVKPEYFFKPTHQALYETMVELHSEGTPIDEITLGDKLLSKGKLEEIGGHVFLNSISNRIETTAHAHYWLEIVREKYFLRRIIQTATETVEKAYSQQEPIEYFLEAVENDFFQISQDRVSDSATPIRVSIDNAVGLVTRMLQRKGKLTGIPTGFIDLDKLTFGLHTQEMIVVAARPSMGKTSIAMNIAEAAVLPLPGSDIKPVPTVVFSLEMSAEQLAMRLLCSRARVDMQKLKDGFLAANSQKDLVRTAAELKAAPLWIDDSAHLSILELRAKARRLHAQHNLGLVIVDYLQLVSGLDSRLPREQQISEISRGMKAMSKELNVPVVVLAQLNRESEKERRQPRVSDLRESGAIEQDADVVMLLSRARDQKEEEEFTGNTIKRELIVAKQRNGPVGSIPLLFNKRITRFENYSEYADDPNS